ncbi:ethanolamine-phosphate phospho-lyase-like [Actinia tenebrosa]|uniref:Ethanolamine-phosphate phospho-lyase-like n=1 Tax=Actinia tenebrosa TaxID=6105 RepID=A0A6P8HC87_ACTTE|nr:ethanolamine-phosphate phospho-lyase-like [Actinia tenebrosa]
MTETKRARPEDLLEGLSNSDDLKKRKMAHGENHMNNGDDKGLTSDEIMAVRRKHIGKSCKVHFAKSPPKITHGRGQYLFDDKGNKCIDCMNNVTHVGHCNPRVIKAAHDQMCILNTNNRFLYDNIIHYTKRLISKFPPHLSVCYFVCSGSEANDLALRLARTHTMRHDTIVVDRAYHGHTSALIDVSPYKFNALGGEGKKDFVHVCPCPDPYRGKYKGYGKETGELYANEVKTLINNAENDGRKIAAFICESMQGCGGQIIYPEGFMKNAFKYVREAGGVCIADEVQVGFGRTGKHFWAFESQDATPDIVTLGKPIGNGHPLAVVITTPEISESFAATGMSYFNTFGGNPVSCAVGNAVLDSLKEDNLVQNAIEVGEAFLEKLRALQQKHELIGDVRGMGLMIGVELVKDRDTLEPATAEAMHMVYRAKDEFVFVSADGPHENVLKIKPPMCFSHEDADYVTKAFDKILTEMHDAENGPK